MADVTDKDREAAFKCGCRWQDIDGVAAAIAKSREEGRAELDAERAAHEETKARLALAEALDTAVANLLSPQRLGCTLEELRDGVVQMANTQPDARAAADTLALIDSLAAWRAAK